MSRQKLKRFAELDTFPNSFSSSEVGRGGQWVKDYFGNDWPLNLELGCGKGEYTCGLARQLPDQNILGVDRKGDRIWKGARQALEESLTNVLFLRARIEDLADYLDNGQVHTIWMPFPDPLPKRKQAKHRLVSPFFMNLYRYLLSSQGRVHLKSDDGSLLDYALEVLEKEKGRVHRVCKDLYGSHLGEPLLEIPTTYEVRHRELGKTIKYLCFSPGMGDDQCCG
jgi:tRNA (guanine-N7-)-methyltransferase